jgi:hypothetical protein
MSALALPKRKASKDPVEDPIEDPDEDDPDFDPENPEECYDIKVVFSNKYKTPLKKPKTCIGAFCSLIKKYYTEFFIDESLCSHEKVKEFFGVEYDKMYILNQADFKESIFTLLKACRPGSKNNILSNSSYIKLLDFATNEVKGDSIIFNKDKRYTSNLFCNIGIDINGNVLYRNIWIFDINKKYIIQVCVRCHIFCIAIIFDHVTGLWGITVIDTISNIFSSKDRHLIYLYLNIILNGDKVKYENVVSNILDDKYSFQTKESSHIRDTVKNPKNFGFCQIWTMFNIFYFMKYGIEKVRSNYKFFIDLLTDESINKDDRYKIMLCILYTWCLHHLNFTRTSVYFKPKKSKTKKSKTKKSKTKKSKTK